MKHVKIYTDEALIAALQPQQAAAELPAVTRFLFKEYFEPFRTYITQNQGTHHEAETMFREVVISFIELARLGKLPSQVSVKTWLYALNRQLWQDELKRRDQKPVQEKPYADENEAGQAPDLGALINGRQTRQQVQEVVARMDDSSRKVLLAFYYENAPLNHVRKIGGYHNDRAASLKKDKALKQLEQMLTANPGMAQQLNRALHYER